MWNFVSGWWICGVECFKVWVVFLFFLFIYCYLCVRSVRVFKVIFSIDGDFWLLDVGYEWCGFGDRD